MGEIFLKLLNMSITAGWLILVVLCVRALFRKIPKWVICLLWGVVAIRLIFPFSIESALSLQPSAEPIKANTVVAGEVLPYVPSVDSDLPIVENTVNLMLAETFAYHEYESVAPLQVVTELAGFVWLLGMALLLVFATVSMIRLHILVKESVYYKDDVYICDAVKSPFILGIIRPGIYLSSALSEEETEYIVAHEKAHLKRKDHLWKPFGYLLLSVYWFNPLCWAAYIMLCRDIELACDEKVIRDMSFADKKEYSRVLLSCATQRRLVMTCPLAFGEVGVKERVKSVLQYKKPAFWITVVAIAACAAIAICFLTNPEKKYQIRITIPAGSTEGFCYSDEEISPKGNTLVLYAGDGLGECEVVLDTVEVREENAYEPTYMTHGMPVEMDVEKGAWFRVGVNLTNPTEEDLDIYVEVKNVEVRIAATENEMNTKETGMISDEEAGEMLQKYLSAVGRWDEDYKIEPLNPADGVIENTKVYRFEVRFQDTVEQVADRLVDNYAITGDGNTVYWYDSANDEFIILPEAPQALSEWVTEEINVEKYDVTHDGVPDYIVTSMKYDPALIEEVSTLQEKIAQHIKYDVITVKVYEGKKNSDTYREENMLWSQEYSEIHMGNGQLSIVQIDGKEYLLTSSLYVGQGLAAYNYEVFSLKKTGEKEVIDRKNVDFEISADDSAESYKEFRSSLNNYINNGILIAACDIDAKEQLIRTQDSPYVPQDYYEYAFSKFGNSEYLSEDIRAQSSTETPLTEVTVNTLPNVSMMMFKYKSWEGDIEIVNETDSELQTGAWYDIQKWEAGAWHRVDELTDGVWQAVAYRLSAGKTTVLQTNWKTLYGELPPGQYRILKKVLAFTAGEEESHYLAAEFEIKMSK